MFNNPVQFRYFRVTANGASYSGYDQSMIDEIEFFKKEEGTSDGGL